MVTGINIFTMDIMEVRIIRSIYLFLIHVVAFVGCASMSPVPMEINTTIGHTVKLKCPYTTEKVYWFYTKDLQHGLVPVKIQRSRVVAQRMFPGESVLELHDPKHVDTGFYVLKPFNSIERLCTIHLNVFSPPAAFCLKSKLTIEEGKTARLSCKGNGNPKPSISWYRKYMNGTCEENATVSGPMLIIHNATRYAAGVYVCVVSNSISSRDCEVELVVEFEPEMEVLQTQIIKQDNKEDLTLMCRVTANPMPTVIWTKGDNYNTLRHNDRYKIFEDVEMLTSHHTKFLILTLSANQLQSDIYDRYWCRLKGYGEPFTVKADVREFSVDDGS